jgi:hypothetical protein
MWRVAAIALSAALAMLATQAVLAQHAPPPRMPPHSGPTPMPHGSMPHGQPTAPASGAPGLAGQDAFAAVAEVVRLLDADASTDWAKVRLERLRQHLIDMNEVVLRAEVVEAPVPGGIAMDVTGAGRTERAIRAMVIPHAAELDRMAAYAAKAEPIPGGARLTVTARDSDTRAVARLRGLGFIGLLTEGAHHGPHHLAMARGEAVAGHTH